MCSRQLECPTAAEHANDKQNKRARLALLCFPNLADGGVCLHVAMRAVRVIPGGASFYGRAQLCRMLVLAWELKAVVVSVLRWLGSQPVPRTTPPCSSAGSADASIRAQEPTAATSSPEAAVT